MKHYSVLKRFIFVSLICAMSLLVTECTSTQEPIPIKRSALFDWEEKIIPAHTSSQELLSIWGEPDEIITGETGKQFTYKDQSSNATDVFLIDTSCDCVKFYEIDLLGRYRDPHIWLTEMINSYGEPEAVTIPQNAFSRSANFIYATQGILIVAQRDQKPDNAIVFTAQYFEPMPLDQFMEIWGANHITNLANQSIWKEYEYVP